MKRVFCSLVAPVALALLASCAQSKPEVVKEGVTAETMKDSLQTASAVRKQAPLTTDKGEYKKQDKYCQFSIGAEWPSGSDAVSSAIRKDLLAVLDKYLAQRGEKRTIPLYNGDTASLQDALKHYGVRAYEILLADSKNNHKIRVETEQEIAAENGEPFKEPQVMPLALDLAINKEEDTAALCVFGIKYYSFTGGAHGLGVSSYITYDKSTGRCFDKFLKPGVAKSMQPLIVTGLKGYFADAENGKAITDLKPYLLVEGNEIPLPAAAPYPTDEGLVFRYGSYEIAPYAAGQPEFCIPYEKIKPYLTAEATALLGL